MNRWIPWIVIAVIILLGAFWMIGSYNALVSERLAVQTAEAKVETQLQRRFDLIPNLVESVKGAQIQEQKVFGDIAKARENYAGSPSGTSQKIQAANNLESAVGRLLVIIENYPQLTSNQTVHDLIVEIEGTENRINIARERYNDTDQSYLQHLQTFPGNIVAGMFHFQPLPLFQAAAGAQTAPKVKFSQ